MDKGKRSSDKEYQATESDDAKLEFSNAAELVKQRQYYKRKPKKAANVLSQLMAHRGIAQQQSTHELSKIWNEISGSCSRHTQLGNIRRGTLEIIVANSMISQQLSFKKQDILVELIARLPNNKIKDLRFRIGNVNR